MGNLRCMVCQSDPPYTEKCVIVFHSSCQLSGLANLLRRARQGKLVPGDLEQLTSEQRKAFVKAVMRQKLDEIDDA